jgi:uncharacterized protein YecE (DUF72 family)
MSVKLGMCGFTIGAAAYYGNFPVVEIQQTFYDPPRIATLERWRAEAPEQFEFTMKAWQVITHLGTSRTYRRLKSPFDDKARAEAGGFRWNETVERAWAHMSQACKRKAAAHPELRDDDEPPATLFPLPHLFYFRERNRFSLDAEFITSSQRPQLRKRIEDGCMRNTATAAPVKLES